MAQRTSTSGQTLTTLDWVEIPTQGDQSPTNDNTRLPSSGLRFREQKSLRRRAGDLSWQMKFAMMKLHHWHDPDNPEWDPLDKFLRVAKAEFKNLGPA